MMFLEVSFTDSSLIQSFMSSRHFAKMRLVTLLSRQSFNYAGTQSLPSKKSAASFGKKKDIGKHSKKSS